MYYFIQGEYILIWSAPVRVTLTKDSENKCPGWDKYIAVVERFQCKAKPDLVFPVEVGARFLDSTSSTIMISPKAGLVSCRLY